MSFKITDYNNFAFGFIWLITATPFELVNNKIIARGEVVVIDDSFGLRITQLAGNIELSSELGLTVGA